ncbi:MAG: flavohemoglobin expression-modulating QEGLA motif protein [Cyclobacteriaceae bacterium]
MSNSATDKFSAQSLAFDRQISFYMEQDLPHLLLYRFAGDEPDPVIKKLLQNEAAYLIAPSQKTRQVKSELTPIISDMTNKFGAFLIVELVESTQAPQQNIAFFEIFGPSQKISTTINTFKQELDNRNFSGVHTLVNVVPASEDDDQRNWWKVEELQQLGCLLISLSISPFYRDQQSGRTYPLVARSMQAQMSEVLKKGIYNFVKTQTKHEAQSFLSLSSRKVDDNVWEIDAELKKIDDQFEFLPLITPINASQAWQEFREKKFKQVPVFRYRMLPMDPELEKRKLYNLPLEKIEDPTITYLFRDKRIELDKMLTALNERETQNFLWSSIQLYGDISSALLTEARKILQLDAVNSEKKNEKIISADDFAEAAYQEFLFLKNQDNGIHPVVDVKDTYNGLMVSKGKMLIGSDFSIPESRLKPLLQHEIGTHALTYYTGTGQPLQILGSGMPGYEELQEGLAVFAEYLVGGFTLDRLQILAARVIAVDSLIRDYDFIKTFELLVDNHQIALADAFQITMRVYRGGGLTKDAVYLKGILNLFDYLKSGNDLEILLCGKIRQDYIPIMQELIARGIANPLTIKPRYLQEKEAVQRLQNIRNMQNLIQLTE